MTNLIESALLDVHVALPGKIKSYDSAAQTVEIELQVLKKLPTTQGDDANERLTDIMNVPVMFPRSKDFFISFPLAKGDTGLVVFNEMSIDQWRSLGRVCDPKDIGRHTLTGAVFIPGLVPNSNAIDTTAPAPTQNISSDLVMGHEAGANVRVKSGNKVHVTKSGGATAGDQVAMAADVAAELAKIGTSIKSLIVAASGGTPYVAYTVSSDNLYADATSPQTLITIPDPPDPE